MIILAKITVGNLNEILTPKKKRSKISFNFEEEKKGSSPKALDILSKSPLNSNSVR